MQTAFISSMSLILSYNIRAYPLKKQNLIF